MFFFVDLDFFVRLPRVVILVCDYNTTHLFTAPHFSVPTIHLRYVRAACARLKFVADVIPIYEIINKSWLKSFHRCCFSVTEASAVMGNSIHASGMCSSEYLHHEYTN